IGGPGAQRDLGNLETARAQTPVVHDGSPARGGVHPEETGQCSREGPRPASFRARPFRARLRRMPPRPTTASGGRFRVRDLLPVGPRRHPRPRPYLEMLQVAWENRDNLPHAWRILSHGVCDGCSLWPRGLKDDVMEGVHLCMTRLRLLRLSMMVVILDELL